MELADGMQFIEAAEFKELLDVIKKDDTNRILLGLIAENCGEKEITDWAQLATKVKQWHEMAQRAKTRVTDIVEQAGITETEPEEEASGVLPH